MLIYRIIYYVIYLCGFDLFIYLQSNKYNSSLSSVLFKQQININTKTASCVKLYHKNLVRFYIQKIKVTLNLKTFNIWTRIIIKITRLFLVFLFYISEYISMNFTYILTYFYTNKGGQNTFPYISFRFRWYDHLFTISM